MIHDFGGFTPSFSSLDMGFNDLGRSSMYYPDFGTVTIDPLTDLAVNTTYSVQIAAGVIADDAGHGYEGLNDFSFTTIASNPLLIYSDPTNNGSLKSDEDITLFFDEAVTAGAGNIVLSNDSETRTIAIDDASQVSFNFDSILWFGNINSPDIDIIINNDTSVWASAYVNDCEVNDTLYLNADSIPNFTLNIKEA